MDWQRARTVLLAAFAVVNVVLAYSVWKPADTLLEPQGAFYMQRVRTTLAESGIDLLTKVPTSPESMRLLRVAYRPTLANVAMHGELSGMISWPDTEIERMFLKEPEGSDGERFNAEAQGVVYRPKGTGGAAMDLNLEDHERVLQAVQDYLRLHDLVPKGPSDSRVYPVSGTVRVMVEYLPTFQEYLIYSGFLRVEVSAQGIESLTEFWVEPIGFKDDVARPARSAPEALLRLAGRLRSSTTRRRAITDIRLGYYVEELPAPFPVDTSREWEAVPVWRIELSDGDVYYLNVFTGEFES